MTLIAHKLDDFCQCNVHPQSNLFQSSRGFLNERGGKNKHIVFVLGPYKSGTSFVTRHIEASGYFNPAQISNEDERARNSQGGTYKTHECRIARSIDRQLHLDMKTEMLYREQGVLGYLKMLEWLGSSKDVIKIPTLVWTIKVWLELAERLNFTCSVILCNRDKNDLESAWEQAPWTKELLHIEPTYLDRMLEQCVKLPKFLTEFANVNVGQIDFGTGGISSTAELIAINNSINGI